MYPELGNRAKDKVTGNVGTVTAKVEYLFGVTRFELTFENATVEPIWVDAPRLEVIPS